MVTEIPSSSDFRRAGVEHLNIAYERLRDLLDLIGDFEEFHGATPGEKPDPDDSVELMIQEWREGVRKRFPPSILRPIGICLALAQQGAEFLLKSRLADVSPYLLLEDSPAQWPSPKDDSEDDEIVFSELKTIPARDLVPAVNKACDESLDDAFVTLFSRLRERRNVVMHSIPSDRAEPEQLLRDILAITSFLLGEGTWLDVRRTYLYEYHPAFVVYNTDDVTDELAHELLWLKDYLKPSEFRDHLGFDPKTGRNYFCPECFFDEYGGHIEARFAKLEPNHPDSTKIYCYICDTRFEVRRQDCPESDCKGNVIADGYSPDHCLTCGSHN